MIGTVALTLSVVLALVVVVSIVHDFIKAERDYKASQAARRANFEVFLNSRGYHSTRNLFE
jgi:hypothetical protein